MLGFDLHVDDAGLRSVCSMLLVPLAVGLVDKQITVLSIKKRISLAVKI